MLKVMQPGATEREHQRSVTLPRFRPSCQGKTFVKPEEPLNPTKEAPKGVERLETGADAGVFPCFLHVSSG